MYTVLYISHGSELSGGANRSLLGLVKNIKKHGIRPIVLVPQIGELTKELEKNEVEYIVSKYYVALYQRTFKYWFYDKIKYILNFKLRYMIKKKVEKYKIDIIHINNSLGIDIGIYLSKKLKVSNVYHIREYIKDDYNLSYSFGLKFLYNKVNKNINKIIYISKDIKNVFDNSLRDIPLENKVVIYNGIEIEEKYELSFKKIYNQNIKICIFGFITEGKNQLSVVNVLIKIIKKFPRVKLYLYGSGEEGYLKRIKNFILKNKMEENVFIMGVTSNPMEEMKKMDIGIMSSKREAFGRVTIEYMLNKLAVIASNSGANSEIIKNMENGLLYDLDNEEDLKNKITLLLENRKLLKELANEGYRTAIRDYTAEKNAKEIYEKVYKKLLNMGEK